METSNPNATVFHVCIYVVCLLLVRGTLYLVYRQRQWRV